MPSPIAVRILITYSVFRGETVRYLEMEMEVEADDLPEFFKVYFTQHSFDRMLIPTEFVGYMGGRKSGLAELAGPSGKTWPVEFVQDEEIFYLANGWQDFVKNNEVQDGNFLFFRFHGNLVFSVTIYDRSMCEKGAVFLDESSEGKDGILGAGEEEKEVRPMKGRSAGRSQPNEDKKAERPAISVKPFFEKCISTFNIKRGAHINFPLSFVVEHSLSYKSYEKMVLRTSRISSWEVNIINRNGKISLHGGWLYFVRDNCIRIGDICKFELLGRLEMMVHVTHLQERVQQKNINESAPKLKSLKRNVGVSQPRLTREGQKAAGRTVPSSVKSSFVVDMKKYNVERSFILNIPFWFIEENSLFYEGNEKMILRTKKHSSWPVNIILNKSMYTFCGGWAAFVHANNIKEGDKCKFELVNRLEMKVYITHAPR